MMQFDTKAASGWMLAAMDAWMLGLEASWVIGTRSSLLMTGGPKASREAQLMIAEKMQAVVELQTKLMMGALTLTPLSVTNQTLRHYRGKVAANRRRLAR